MSYNEEKENTKENKKKNFLGDPIERRFNLVQILRNNASGEMLLLQSYDNPTFYICRHINALNLSFEKIANIPNEHLPQIIYSNEDKSFKITTVIEEYISGISLDLWMKDRDYDPINDEMAGIIFSQLADGIASLHKKDLVHRSISPANIMLSGGRNIKILGLSHVVDKFSVDNNNYKGMLGFAAPEQVLTGRADYKSDVYSIGMTMLHLLGTGYNGKYKDILKRCISDNPDDRYSSAISLKQAIKAKQNLSITKVMMILFLTYAIIMGSLFFINRHFSPIISFQTKNESVDTTPYVEANNNLPNGSNLEGSGETTTNSEKKLSMLLNVPGKTQGDKSTNITVKLGNYRKLEKDPKAGVNAVLVPKGTKLVLSIKNNTKEDIMNPVFKFIPSYMNLSQIPDPPNTITQHEGDIVRCQRDINIPAGSEMEFSLPLAGAVLIEPFKATPTIKVVLQSSNYPDIQAEASFKF